MQGVVARDGDEIVVAKLPGRGANVDAEDVSRGGRLRCGTIVVPVQWSGLRPWAGTLRSGARESPSSPRDELREPDEPLGQEIVGSNSYALAARS
jgi:hypothetical protein